MWEIDISNQLFTFLLSVVLGFIFCIIYDLLRAVRKVGFNSATATFITDILYWIVIAFLTFIFLLARTNGEIRGYVLFCALGGFVIFRFTVSKLLFKLFVLIVCGMVKAVRLIHSVFYSIYDRFSNQINKVFTKFAKTCKRGLKKLKKLLKYRYSMLYTKGNEKASKEGDG